MEGSADSIREPAKIDVRPNVQVYSELTQRAEGDCLSEGFVSALPERCRLDFRRNDLIELTEIWNQMGTLGLQDQFESKYGDIAHLAKVNVNEDLIRAAIRFWDPSYRCFVFNEADMTPTIEEYSVILGLKYEPSHHVYERETTITYRKKIIKLLKVSAEEAETLEKNCSIPWFVLKNHIMKYMGEEKCMPAVALAIYGLILFPKKLKCIDLAVVDLLEQMEYMVRPEPTILAETIRGLNSCRRNGGRFYGCSHLLYIWLQSHFKSITMAFDYVYRPHRPILEFIENEWPKKKCESEWVQFLLNLDNTEIVWRAPWFLPRPAVYMTKEKPWLPLIGIWGVVSYAPLMVRRQFGAKQFIPMTHGLASMEIDYGQPKTLDYSRKASHMWGESFQIICDHLAGQVFPNYQEWQTRRIKDLGTMQKRIHPEDIPPPSLADKVEWAKQVFEEERKGLENEIRNLQYLLSQEKKDKQMTILEWEGRLKKESELKEDWREKCEIVTKDFNNQSGLVKKLSLQVMNLEKKTERLERETRGVKRQHNLFVEETKIEIKRAKIQEEELKTLKQKYKAKEEELETVIRASGRGDLE